MRLLFLLLFSPLLLANPCPQWSPAQAENRLSALKKEILHHDTLYFHQHKTDISDTEYDQLRQHLADLSICFPYLPKAGFSPSSPKNTQQVHQASMGSLNKAHDEQHVATFLKKAVGQTILLQPKIDGIAIELVYENGLLTSASTRGDGSKGQAILQQMQQVTALPKHINRKEKTILHGELFARLDKLSNHHGYTTARHFVAAHIHRSKTDTDAMAQLDFFPWTWVNAPYQTERQNIAALINEGFLWPGQYTYQVESLQDIKSFRKSFYQPAKPLPFLLDGIVIKLDSLTARQQWGANQAAPHWALAWKFPASTAVTLITEISFTIGRTGIITPVLTVEARDIGGLTVSSLSLGSIASLKEKRLSVGDHIIIQLTGRATPALKRVLIRQPGSKLPTTPDQALYNNFSCLSWSESCHQQFLARLTWLVGSKGLNLPFLTARHLSKLVQSGQIVSLHQLLSISGEEFTRAGMSASQANTLKRTITQLPMLPFKQRLLAISPPGIGMQKAQLIAESYDDFQSLKITSAKKLAVKINSSDTFTQRLLDFLKLPEVGLLIERLSRDHSRF